MHTNSVIFKFAIHMYLIKQELELSYNINSYKIHREFNYLISMNFGNLSFAFLLQFSLNSLFYLPIQLKIIHKIHLIDVHKNRSPAPHINPRVAHDKAQRTLPATHIAAYNFPI